MYTDNCATMLMFYQLTLCIVATDFNIDFASRIYTVSEDDDFVDLTIIKTPIINGSTVSITENVTVYFYTYDGSAKGKI